LSESLSHLKVTNLGAFFKRPKRKL